MLWNNTLKRMVSAFISIPDDPTLIRELNTEGDDTLDILKYRITLT